MLAEELAGLVKGDQLAVAELQPDGLAYVFCDELRRRFRVSQAVFSFAEPAAQIDCIREDSVRSPDERIVKILPADVRIEYGLRLGFFLLPLWLARASVRIRALRPFSAPLRAL